MTLAEFKAWFEGYTEAIEGAPTAAQFDKIKKKVAALEPMTLKPPAPFYPPNTRDFTYLDHLTADAQSYWDRGSALGRRMALEGAK